MTTNTQCCEYDEDGILKYCYWRDCVLVKQTKYLENLLSQLQDQEKLLSDYERQLSDQDAEIQTLTHLLNAIQE